MKRSIIAGGALSLAVLVAPAVAGDPDGLAVVNRQLDAVASNHPSEDGRATGQLAQGGSRIVTIDAPGGDITFIGVCDRSCTDVDLIVRDASGREIGRDELPDDAPVVIARGAAGGRYALELSMRACTSSCYWGVGAFH